jgi:hypothetical protein
MPAGRYTVMDGAGSPVGSEDFRCAPGPMGWRYFSTIQTSEPESHEGVVDLAVDAIWRPERTRIATRGHELLLARQGDRLTGRRDGEPLELPFGSEVHLDYRSPVFSAVSASRLGGGAGIDVIRLRAGTLEPEVERQRYDLIGDEEIATPAGRFAARRWRLTAPAAGGSRDLWIAADVLVRFEGLFQLEWYEAGASGPRPLDARP